MNFSSLHLIYYSSTPLARTWYKLLVSSVQHSQCPSLWFPQGTICNKHEELLEEGLLAVCSTNLPSSLECTTKGPPESPCGRIIMLMIFLLSLTNPPDRNLCCHFRSPHTWKSPGWPENIFQNVKLADIKIYNILHSGESYFLHKVPVSWTENLPLLLLHSYLVSPSRQEHVLTLLVRHDGDSGLTMIILISIIVIIIIISYILQYWRQDSSLTEPAPARHGAELSWWLLIINLTCQA